MVTAAVTAAILFTVKQKRDQDVANARGQSRGDHSQRAPKRVRGILKAERSECSYL
jgi:hypothetical protein